MIEWLLATGHIADIILGFMAIEAVLLSVYWRRTGRGVSIRGMAGNFLAGAALVLALRAALTNAGAVLIVVALAAALAAHGLDVSQRWRS